MRQIQNRKRIQRITAFLLAVIFLFVIGAVTAAAVDIETPSKGGAIAESTLVRGTQKLFSDLSGTALWLAPTVTAVLCAYFGLRLSAAPDDQDKKAWMNRIKTSLIVLVFVFSISGIIKIATSYYGGSTV